MNVEESLRQIRGKAALIGYLASSATINPETPDSVVLEGMADVSAEIEELAQAVKSALSVSALDETI